MSRERGTVKWFNDQKGIGVITPSAGGGDLSVHQIAIEVDQHHLPCPPAAIVIELTYTQTDGFQILEEGQNVSFVAEKGQKGLQAVQVRVEG